MSSVSLTATADGERLALVAAGTWTADRAAELEKIIDETARRYVGARSVDIDLAELERLDTYGAWLIERLKRAFIVRGSAARITGLSDADRALIAELQLVNQAPARKRATAFCWRSIRSAAASPKWAGRSSCWRKCSAR
jgi:phospholipid/cholesterol/gamma-HCH transport system permease protein